MAPLWQQRSELIDENTRLICKWLADLDDEGKYNVIHSMVRNFTIKDLRAMRDHVRDLLLPGTGGG
jgi:hypothetical protein